MRVLPSALHRYPAIFDQNAEHVLNRGSSILTSGYDVDAAAACRAGGVSSSREVAMNQEAMWDDLSDPKRTAFKRRRDRGDAMARKAIEARRQWQAKQAAFKAFIAEQTAELARDD
jgi:hypothetical protein